MGGALHARGNSDYCQADVEALARLLPVMLPRIDLPRALLRGRYMIAASAVQRYGVPIDIEMLQRFTAAVGGDTGEADCCDRRGLWRLRRAHVQAGPFCRLARSPDPLASAE